MARRTINRMPLSVSTNANDYSKSAFFNHVEFKGICDDKNNITIDQQTFADANNILVDEDDVLTSRASFKFYDGEAYIIDQWRFGEYGLRLQRVIDDKTYFIIHCTTHVTYDGANEVPLVYGWSITDDIGEEYAPMVTCMQIEDKIFVWFAGADLIVLNTAGKIFANGKRYPVFEKGVSYLYYPVHKLVVNNIENELESKNFLTNTYKKRYQYSTLSSINFDALRDKHLAVYLNSDSTQDKSKYLYDINLYSGVENLIVYPHLPIGDDYHIDIVQTPRAMVIMRYNKTANLIEVSFDGRYFKALPPLNDILGKPMLTRDGFWVVAFTSTGIAKCQLVTQSSTMSEELFVWSSDYYARKALFRDTPPSHVAIDPSFVPVGYFETIDKFVYVFLGDRNGYAFKVQQIYAEYPSGTNIIHISEPLRVSSDSDLQTDRFTSNDIRVGLYYVPQDGDALNIRTAVYIMSAEDNLYEGETLVTRKANLTLFLFDDRLATDANNYKSLLVKEVYIPLSVKDTSGELNGFISSCDKLDMELRYTKNGLDTIYTIYLSYNLGYANGEYDVYGSVTYNYTRLSLTKDLTPVAHEADWFKIRPNTTSVFTNVGARIDNQNVRFPLDLRVTYIGDKDMIPIDVTDNSVWYYLDGSLWTSGVDSKNSLEFDEYVNATVREVSVPSIPAGDEYFYTEVTVNLRNDLPYYTLTSNAHYFAFRTIETGRNLLEISSIRRDEDKLFSDENADLLLYLPKRNEQAFANPITNLHPLSNTEIGVFTENEIWHVGAVTLSDDSIAYTAAIKSKLPVGCRDGSDVITSFDGQAILFATARGITVLAPQDFVATQERVLSYLSDMIQDKYYKFYNDVTTKLNKPMIKMCTYKYWVFIYKYMSRDVLVFDTRGGAWWSITTQYPIIKMLAGTRLHVLMRIDPLNETEASLLGVSFIFTDREINAIDYYDDVVADTINGDGEVIYDTRTRHRATPMIDWYATSQKLHLNQINNYKLIKSMTLNLRGLNTMTARLTTKAFRDLNHPEKHIVIEMSVNELRTFITRMNLMHVIDFQYKFVNNEEIEPQYPLQLNSLTVRYEVKERIR